ncbi:MAG: DUF302 domain-containing protein [Pseudaminobacter sp.]
MRSLILAAFIGLAAMVALPAFARDDVTKYTSQAPFADVAADLADAIVNRGYKIDYHGFIGEMLQRTAEDVGASTQLYRNAEIFQFCSAVVSRAVMEENIENIAFCPYVLFVYEAEAEAGTVNVGFRRLPDGEGRDAVNTLLDEIVKEAAGQ